MGYAHLDNPSDVDEFFADIQTIAPPTRAEEGCLFYAVTLDDASAGRLLVVEQRHDPQSLADHLAGAQAAAFQKWLNKIQIDVLKYDASNERSLRDRTVRPAPASDCNGESTLATNRLAALIAQTFDAVEKLVGARVVSLSTRRAERFENCAVAILRCGFVVTAVGG